METIVIYSKEIDGMLAQITYNLPQEVINLLIVNKTPKNTDWYGNHQFRDMMINKPQDLDFLLNRCYIYRLLGDDSTIAANSPNNSPLYFSRLD